MLPRSTSLFAVFVLYVCAFPQFGNAKAVHKQIPTANGQERSAGLVAQGVLALASRNFAAAYAALSEAYLIDHSPDTLYQLGIVAYAEGQTVFSQDLMRRYLATVPANEKNAQQRAEAERIVSQPQGQSSEIIVTGSPEQSVFVDGKLAGILPLPLPLLVTAGRHLLVIKDKTQQHSVPLEAVSHRAYEITVPRADETGNVSPKSLSTVVLAMDADVAQGLSSGRPLLDKAIAQGGAFVVPAVLSGREECKSDERCLIRVADQSFADYLLKIDGVQNATSSGGTVSITLFDSQIGETAASKSFPCSPCTENTLAENVASLFPDLLAQSNQRGRGFLQIGSQPAGALVQIKGRKIGPTPIRIPRFSGPVDLELSRPGYKPAQKQAEIQAGQTTELAVELTEELVAPLVLKLPPERRPRPKWRIAMGISSLGIGLGLVGLGASALAISGTCVEAAAPPVENCARLYQTTTAGAALVGSGSVLGITGILLLAIPGPRNKDLRPIPSDAGGPWAFDR